MRINAKSAKKLRKMAATLVEIEKSKNPNIDTKEVLLENTSKRKTVLVDGPSGPIPFEIHGPIYMNPYSIKGIYKRLKRSLRQRKSMTV